MHENIAKIALLTKQYEVTKQIVAINSLVIQHN